MLRKRYLNLYPAVYKPQIPYFWPRQQYEELFELLKEEMQPQTSFEYILLDRIVSHMLDIQRCTYTESASENNGILDKKETEEEYFLLRKSLGRNPVSPEKLAEDGLHDKHIHIWNPDEIYIRYKHESETRLLKAMRLWLELHRL